MEKIKINHRHVAERRTTLAWFQDIQMSKLVENVHKGSWKDKTIPFLLERMKQEVQELEDAIELGNHDEIFREAGDIANFAMFIADKFK